MSEELDVLKDIAQQLNDAAIPYMVSGSMAMNFYARPRMTRDIDIVVVLNEADVGRFVSLFGSDYYVDADVVREEIRRRGMFNLIHNRLILKVDFILQKQGEYDSMALERRRRIDLDGVQIWMISAEDLIIRKLQWAKDTLSEMQIGDVRNIIEMASDLDTNYVESWVGRLGLDELYAKVRSDSLL
ncbi:MAG: nucleotidyltransferase [bacterium]